MAWGRSKSAQTPAWSQDDYHTDFAAKIKDQIEQGVAPWQKPWKPGERRLPENVASKKPYRGGNSVYLSVTQTAKGYSDHRWATYKQIKDMGGQVRKGEKATHVLFYKFDDEREKPQPGAPETPTTSPDGTADKERTRPPMVRCYAVFNVEQADSLQLERQGDDREQEPDPAAHAAFVEPLASLEHHGARAMTTFLDHPACWRRTTRFFHAEALPAWRKRIHLPHVPAAVDAASLQALAAGLSTYFRRTEGRGTHCVVEPIRRGTLDYFFAYPEDYSQHSVEWVDGQFGQRPHHPAFEVIYVYSQPDGTLDVNIRGARPAVEPLQGLFAATILKQTTLPPDPTDDRVYDLNALREPGFEFVYESGSGIQDVVVTALRLASRVTTGDRLTLEADTVGHPTAVYDLLARLGSAVPLHLYRVTQVELAASVITEITQPPQHVTIRLTHPNACSLPYDNLGLTLRAMLHASGIEPKAPAEAVAPAE